ncbi:MAG TPA: type 4a pilus biogenesis protein PilO [Candidatus Saccharimonadia bacterium]|jgi:Tfp pilus assembly protein PilO
MKPKIFFFVMLGIFIAVLGLGGVGYYFGLKFVQSKSQDLAAQLAEQKVADDQISSLQKLDNKYNKDIVPILALIDEALPRDKKQTEILAQIERIAANNGMTLTAVTMPGPTGLPSGVSQTIQAGQVLALPINFHIDGTYTQLENFTSQLEDLNRFTNITTLVVQRKTPGAEYTFTLNAYIKP